MTRRPESIGLAVRVGSVLALAAVIGLAVGGCKSNKDEKDIERIKKNLEAMLKHPVDMHQVQVNQVQQAFTKELRALLKKPDPAARAKLIKQITTEKNVMKVKLFADEILAINVSPDNWLVNGEPAGLVVNNTTKWPMAAEINMGCGAPSSRYPITATVDDGQTQQKVVFTDIGNKTVKFHDVPAGKKQLFILTTDKTWTPGNHDKRQLGVRLFVTLRPFLATLIKHPDEKRRQKIVKAAFAGEVSDYMPLVEPYLASVSLSPDGWTTDQGPSGIVVDNAAKKPLTPEVTLTARGPASQFPLTVTFRDGVKVHKVVFKKPGHLLYKLPTVAPNSKQLFIVQTNKHWKPNPKMSFGLGIRITNPLDGTLRDLLGKPDAARRAKLIDDMLNMQVDKLNILGDLVVAIGLSGDRWTLDGEPAGLAVRNAGKQPLALKVTLSCGVTEADGPVVAIVDDGMNEQKVVFKHASSQSVLLSSIPPGGKRLYIITTDKTWTPGTHDHRRLGVNVGITLGPVLRAVLRGGGKEIRSYLAGAVMNGHMMGRVMLVEHVMAAIGLSADHWTENGEPAAIVSRNPSNKAWTPRITLTVGATKKDLPVSVFIDDGEEKQKVVFQNADSRTVSLSPVGPGQNKLYVVTTDKTWQAPPDPRQLGVNLGVPNSLKAPVVPRPPAKPPVAQGKAK